MGRAPLGDVTQKKYFLSQNLGAPPLSLPRNSLRAALALIVGRFRRNLDEAWVFLVFFLYANH